MYIYINYLNEFRGVPGRAPAICLIRFFICSSPRLPVWCSAGALPSGFQ